MPVNQFNLLNLENSNEIETKLKEQNETKPELVQAEKQTNNSKTTYKIVYTKYKKGQRIAPKKLKQQNIYDCDNHSHIEMIGKKTEQQAKKQLKLLYL